MEPENYCEKYEMEIEKGAMKGIDLLYRQCILLKSYNLNGYY